MNHKKYDPAMEKLKPGTKVGIGRPHGPGLSSGIYGKEVLKAPCSYKAGPITQLAKG